jgi:hypothetical protein
MPMATRPACSDLIRMVVPPPADGAKVLREPREID